MSLLVFLAAIRKLHLNLGLELIKYLSDFVSLKYKLERSENQEVSINSFQIDLN
jgi:hypothetical protein